MWAGDLGKPKVEDLYYYRFLNKPDKIDHWLKTTRFKFNECLGSFKTDEEAWDHVDRYITNDFSEKTIKKSRVFLDVNSSTMSAIEIERKRALLSGAASGLGLRKVVNWVEKWNEKHTYAPCCWGKSCLCTNCKGFAAALYEYLGNQADDITNISRIYNIRSSLL